MSDKFNIRLADWQYPQDQAALKLIRTLVFIHEQHVPPALEWDEDDKTAIHLLAIDHHAGPIGCTRLVMSSELNQLTKSSGKIGRMAVLAAWRKQGVGNVLLRAAIAYFQQHDIQYITLSAQVHAIGFYQHAGFIVTSEPYLDAGIPHVDMQLVNRDT